MQQQSILQQTNAVDEFVSLLGECHPNDNNPNIGYITTKSWHRLTCHLSDNSSIKSHISYITK